MRAIAVGLIRVFLAALLVLSARPAPAQAQEDAEQRTLALFTPSLALRDAVQAHALAASLARTLTAATGSPWRGEAFAREADFRARVRGGQVDLALIDGPLFAADLSERAPIASASAAGQTSHPMALLVRPGAAASLPELRGETLIIAHSGPLALNFIRGALLEALIDPDAFFGAIEVARDAHTALSAVALGKADAVLAFADSRGDLREVARLDAVPLPVVVITSERLDPATRTVIEAALRATPVAAPPMTGFTTYDASPILRYRDLARRRAATLAPRPAPPTPLTPESLTPPTIPDEPPRLDPAPLDDLSALPDLSGAVAP